MPSLPLQPNLLELYFLSAKQKRRLLRPAAHTYITACWEAMFNHTALGATLSSSTLLCLRRSFRPPADGLGLPGGVIRRAVLTTGGGVVLPGLGSSRRDVDLRSGASVPLLLSSRRDIDLLTGLFSRLAVAAEAATAPAMSSPREIVREGARLGITRLSCLRWVRSLSLVPVGRANHLAPRCFAVLESKSKEKGRWIIET